VYRDHVVGASEEVERDISKLAGAFLWIGFDRNDIDLKIRAELIEAGTANWIQEILNGFAVEVDDASHGLNFVGVVSSHVNPEKLTV